MYYFVGIVIILSTHMICLLVYAAQTRIYRLRKMPKGNIIVAERFIKATLIRGASKHQNIVPWNNKANESYGISTRKWTTGSYHKCSWVTAILNARHSGSTVGNVATVRKSSIPLSRIWTTSWSMVYVRCKYTCFDWRLLIMKWRLVW